MLSPFILLLFGLPILCDGRILLYDTENITLSSEKFDCIYIFDTVDSEHGGSSAGKVPYCRRPNITDDHARTHNKCENEAEMEYFVDLLQKNVRPFEVLEWSSSIDMADEYAAFYHNNYSMFQSNEKQNFLCHCTHLGTFGKYCEYELTHEANSFEASQNLQASFRFHNFQDHQKYGDIVCYKTLSCYSGLLCLDWRDICDGKQQCENGWDEENCDKLEFNECEDDEFRCTNGMCIPEEYWLDGDKDCMDWSDENDHHEHGAWCFQEKTTIDCDEHLCFLSFWSCGDGICTLWKDRLIFQNVLPKDLGCLNLRNINYMCELASPGYTWTLSTGLCWTFNERYDDPRLSMNNDALTDKEKCIYLIRCALSDGFELDCPCDRYNCSLIMPNVCERDQMYLYPPGPLIYSYVYTYYDWTSDFKDKMPHEIQVFGNIRCQGYHGLFLSQVQFILSSAVILFSTWDSALCSARTIIRNNTSSMKYDGECWKNSLTFSGRPYAVHDICTVYHRCISQYRINDGHFDCLYLDDENVFITDKDLCIRVRKHRFQCSSEQPVCFTMFDLGNGFDSCSNKYDEYLYGYGRSIKEIICRKSELANCQLLREYIKNSSLISNSSTNLDSHIHQAQNQSTSRIPFRSYCNTFWNLQGHIDELPQYCQNWICRRDQYQCQTGQCIPLGWVCDGQWDCADASDEEGMLAIHHWSLHNQKLKDLNEKREKCLQDYSNLPFSQFCDIKKEFPCIRSNLSNALDMEENHLCIPYSKIGDEIEDCYNAYDEKNTFETNDGQMWGFSVRCDNWSRKYIDACEQATYGCTQILCPYRYYQLPNCGKPTDAVCINDNRCIPGGRCDSVRDCTYGEDEYWCPPKDFNEQLTYRHGKLRKENNHTIFDRQIYPSLHLATKTFKIVPQSLVSNSIIMTRNLQNSNLEFSFWCNRGVTVIMFNQKVCFCPPAYFGDKCQFFSDRITIITHLNLTTWPSLSATNSIISITMPTLFKIKVNLLFKEIIVDHYEFHSNPTVEMRNYIKHKFYLLYSRSTQMLSHKQTRFYNRSDIENNHPYSVHFDIYALHNNQNTPIALGSWHYPIYFDFLPSFRLATVLRFPIWLGNSSLDSCANHTCNQNSTCQPIFNQNNSYICVCKSGFYEKDCSKYEETCNSYCSPHSFCRPDGHSIITNTNNPFCICPLGHFGLRCFLKFEQCDSNPCLNNGSCVYTNESYSGDTLVCTCSKFFYGDRCQYAKMALQVRLNTSFILELPRATTIQFYDVDNKTLELDLQHQQVTQGFPSSIYYDHDRIIVPALGVLKTHYDSIQSEYFIFYLQPNTSSINISSTPENCPHASTLLKENDFLKMSNVFKYHHICQNDSERLCFHDENYLCICEWDHYRVDCFMHDTRMDHCTKCLSNGKCIKSDIHDDNNFICLCPRCYQGRLCEFNMQAFGFTLDSLLVDYSKAMKIVPFSTTFLLFIVGLFNNFCSFVTFKRPVPRKFGVGNYLFIITFLNQMSLLCLLIKFIQITFGITNVESCKTISYLFSVFTRLTYWLTSWVTIDRLFVIFFPTSIALKKPRLAIGTSIITSFFLFGMHIHEFIYYTSIQYPSTNSSICVTNFDNNLISTYNRVSTLVHYLLPFNIQVIAVTLLIVLVAHSRNKTAGGKLAFRQVLIKQFRTRKELYIIPITIIVSALPQTIFTFTFTCRELTIWHRHILLITYLLSYTPQVLGFILYVLPSTIYKKEFSETLFAKRYLCWTFNKKKGAMPIPKRK